MTLTDVLDPASRHIPLDGPVNFRDLGGYRGLDGRTVTWRSVFRADGLDSMSSRDAQVVFGDLDIRTVIDLRTEREIEIVGVGPLAEIVGLEWSNISIIDETQVNWRNALEQGTIVDQYVVMLEGSGDKFVEALAIVADCDAPTVFHCAAGKDRTGLLACLLLSLLGVSDKQIVHDYALTADVLPHLQARYEARTRDPRFREHYEKIPNLREVAQKMLTADSATLTAVLAYMRSTCGSPDAWLLQHGMDPEIRDRLRVRLLV